jgi:ketosteroid isomerase-like protein
MTPFRAAVEARDFDALGDLLADDVVFRSPVAFRPYEGRAMVHAILRGVDRVFGELRYVDELSDATGRSTALVFETSVGDVAVHGCDFIRVDDDGRVAELTVMVRPLSAARALADAMAAQFDRIVAEATAAAKE